MTFREMGCQIGGTVRFVDDPQDTVRIIETEEQLDYNHSLPWIVISKGPKVERIT